ncbi:MAG TPA: CDP-alcohol phosphatidyltransferase family protein [Allosphingosinicella sp.]|nr:CDP-alcohol phosphatidyltransferase family protein [Allosphingosinicella sp.]
MDDVKGLVPEIYYDMIARIAAGVPFVAILISPNFAEIERVSNFKSFALLFGLGYIAGHLLTTVSVVVMPPLIYMESTTSCSIASVIFLFAVLTDAADGFVARAMGQTTSLGAKLDPLADKILVYSTLFSLMSIDILHPLAVFPMFFRDMIVDGLRNEISSTTPIGANIWGKSKFGFQAVSILLGLLSCVGQTAALASAANIALIIALLVSLPGLLQLASGIAKNSPAERPALQPE